ncbi:SOD_CuZN10 [Ramazzottius varieornatus]|uniref:SOD_CuZN10 n=1 Tax=Ramazzottius varieornatus TaxID=947166 RepID=A0A1D1V2N7_RAMVA|nr:SOD_CuZN10 [Ramazzottius varieornatus]
MYCSLAILLLSAASILAQGTYYTAPNGTSINSCGTSGPYMARALMAPRGAINSGEAVLGNITFMQAAAGQPTTITGQITGLTPNVMLGFHVHQLGDLSNGCDSALEHYNPRMKTHGDLTNPNRHNGDLGNVQSDANGVANINKQSDLLALIGPESVIGRTIIVHRLMDDLGLGGTAESLASGSANGRSACGIIGQLRPT